MIHEAATPAKNARPDYSSLDREDRTGGTWILNLGFWTFRPLSAAGNAVDSTGRRTGQRFCGRIRAGGHRAAKLSNWQSWAPALEDSCHPCGQPARPACSLSAQLYLQELFNELADRLARQLRYREETSLVVRRFGSRPAVEDRLPSAPRAVIFALHGSNIPGGEVSGRLFGRDGGFSETLLSHAISEASR